MESKRASRSQTQTQLKSSRNITTIVWKVWNKGIYCCCSCAHSASIGFIYRLHFGDSVLMIDNRFFWGINGRKSTAKRLTIGCQLSVSRILANWLFAQNWSSVWAATKFGWSGLSYSQNQSALVTGGCKDVHLLAHLLQLTIIFQTHKIQL